VAHNAQEMQESQGPGDIATAVAEGGDAIAKEVCGISQELLSLRSSKLGPNAKLEVGDGQGKTGTGMGGA
jgi:hypothetical protein